MPTILSHALLPATGARLMRRLPGAIVGAGCVLAMLPDADVLGFRLGVAYGDIWGHRGATHSLGFAAIVVAMLAAVWPLARNWRAAGFLYAAMISHGLLDTLTDGGKGVALLWPFSAARWFAPWRPIRVSPIGTHFFSIRGLETLESEILWIWLPCAIVAGGVWLLRRRDAARNTGA